MHFNKLKMTILALLVTNIDTQMTKGTNSYNSKWIRQNNNNIHHPLKALNNL